MVNFNCVDGNIECDNTNVVFKMSKVLNDQCEDDPCIEDIPILNVDMNLMNDIIEFCNIYSKHSDSYTEWKNVKKPLINNNLIESGFNEECLEFLNKYNEVEDIYKLINAANYLALNILIEVLCAKIATYIKGKPVEEVKKILNIQ